MVRQALVGTSFIFPLVWIDPDQGDRQHPRTLARGTSVLGGRRPIDMVGDAAGIQWSFANLAGSDSQSFNL